MWSNGDPVTANDFAFAWQQALTPLWPPTTPTSCTSSRTLRRTTTTRATAADPEAWEEANAELEEPQDPPAEVKWEDVGVKVLDDMTLEVTLENPIPYAPFMFAFGTLAPINQAFYEECGPGPVQQRCRVLLHQRRLRDDRVGPRQPDGADQNPNYRNKDSLPVDTLNFRIISDGQTL